MNSGKIFIVNVSKGRIGEDNSALLGAMLITKIQLASMERVRVPEDERVDFYLYVDEFQNFATDSFASILSESRKYRLDLILAHQYIGQLVTDVSTKVRDAVFGNVGTMVCFRVGAADAEFLESEFDPEFAPADFVNLPNYTIYLKLMVDGVTSRPFSAKTLMPFKVNSSSELVKTIIENSKKRYARPSWMVEKEINEWSGMGGPGMTASGPIGASGKYQVVCSSCGKTTTVPFEPQPRPACLLPGLPRENKGGGIEADSVRPRFCSFTPGSKPAIFRFGRFGHRVRAEGAGIYRSEEREFPADKKSFRSFQTQAGNFPAATLGRFRRKAVYGRNGKTWSFSLELSKPHEEKRTKDPKEEMNVESLKDALKDALTKI